MVVNIYFKILVDIRFLNNILYKFQLECKGSKEADQSIHDLVFPLGRKHANLGATVPDMEILGILMVKSLMKAVPKDEVGETQHEKITEAFCVFFKVILYWLNFGVNYENRCSV